MAVGIRPAREADIDSIRTVASRAWHAGHAPIIGTRTVEKFLDEYYDADSFRSRIEDEAVLLSVAEDPDAGVVGFAMATPGDDDADYDLSQLYVLPDRWGEGIGSGLLDRIERRVETHGGERIRLGVMAENERAIRFYESAGYEYEDEFHDDFVDTTSRVYLKSL